MDHGADAHWDDDGRRDGGIGETPIGGHRMSRRQPTAVVLSALIAAAVVAGLTAVVIVHPGPLPGEVGYIRWLQRAGEPIPAGTNLVRTLTGTEAGLIVAVVPAIWLIRRDRRRGSAAVAIALVAMLVIQPVAKDIVDRPRPDASQVEVRGVYESESFPSGHSLSTATVWGAAALVVWRVGNGRRPGLRRAIAIALALPIAITGIASGVQGTHWPSDAIAGTLIGLLATSAIARLVAPPRNATETAP